MTTDAPQHDDAVVDEAPAHRPPPPSQTLGGGRFGGGGMPGEHVDDLQGAVGRLIDRVRPERPAVTFVLLAAVGSAILLALGPRYLGHATDVLVDAVTGRTDGLDRSRLARILAVVVGLYLVGSTLTFLQSYVLAGVVQRTMHRLRDDVEAKLHRLSLAYVDSQPRGDILSRVTNDIDNLAQSLQQTMSQLLMSALSIVAVVVMMITISPPLALIALVLIPASILVVRLITKRSRGRFARQWQHTGALNAQVEEAFTGHALVRVFGQRAAVEERFARENEELYRAGFGGQFLAGLVQPLMMFLGNLNYVAIAVIGGLRVSSGAMSIGDIQAFIQYSRQFTQPLIQMASMVNVVQSGLASAERVFELLDVDEQSPDPPASVFAEAPTGRVVFDDVSFSYRADQPLIEHLSLVAEPGQTIAIVGPTGAGKTTLVNLIMRFYELDGGRITIDGHDIASMSRAELRAQIGMVLQDTWLFTGTIRENIRYGNLGATDEQVLAAARATYVDRFVHSLPDGYDTVVDDEGSTVSAGEKQLLTIARAFLADPALLILDEATSSVDTRTEVLIQRAMATLRSRRTSFVIAHRLSTIRDADLILVMDNGRIVEQGDHPGLLARGGAYAALYQAQFAGPADTDIV